MLALNLLISFALIWPAPLPGQIAGFAGRWQLNRDRSEDLTGGLAGAHYALEVSQNSRELTIEEQVTIRGRTQPAQPLTYRLDGTSSTAEVSRPIAGTLELEARILAKGQQLELKSTISGDHENAPVTLITTEFWELIDGGKRLRITRRREFGEKSRQMILVFDRG
ncbi:MAG: hypothetical protein RIR52_2199 [Acidobacteriota bacterium]|jgi:hypothetical protein